jgi:UDP-3-O-[3-hydroxymyristoyl] glucosamine N-acyltransferase
MNDIPGGGVYVGIPATPMREQLHKQAALSKLPEMRKQLKALQKRVEQLDGRRADAARVRRNNAA